MSQAEALLDGVTSYTIDPANEGHIVIGPDRSIFIPEELKNIAVQYDHNIETVTFDCPRYWDGHDMSLMKIYINYMRADDEKNSAPGKNVRVDENDPSMMHFDWTIDGFLTEIQGSITFLVCAKKTDGSGKETQHWNSELSVREMYVSPGMETEAVVYSHYPGIVTLLLSRMDTVENKTTRESMLNYVETYLTETSPTWLETFSKSETVLNLVRDYMEEAGLNVSSHIVVSTEKPSFPCTWFHVTNIISGTAVDSHNIYIADSVTGISYKIHIVDGKLTMSEVYVEPESNVYIY